MVFSLVSYYPLNIGLQDQTISLWRTILAISMASQILVLLILRFTTIIVHHDKNKQGQANQNQSITSNICHAFKERLDKQQNQPKQTKIREAFVHLSNGYKFRQKSSEQNKLQNGRLKHKRKQTNIFQYEEPKSQFSPSRVFESCSSRIQSSCSSVFQENLSKKIGHPSGQKKEQKSINEQFIKYQLNLRFLQVNEKQYSDQANILIAHFMIAACAAFMYYPFWYIALLAVFHLLILLILILTSIFVEKNGSIRTVITIVGVMLIFVINLSLLAFAVLGIARSNSKFSNLGKTE